MHFTLVLSLSLFAYLTYICIKDNMSSPQLGHPKLELPLLTVLPLRRGLARLQSSVYHNPVLSQPCRMLHRAKACGMEE